MVIHYPPGRLRTSDQPTAITNVLVATSASSHRTGDLPLGTPTCSARSRHGRWALYQGGADVIVVWPGGALAGPPTEVAGALDRLDGEHDDLDRAAASAIRQLLTDPATHDGAHWSPTRARTWSSPAKGYWLSSPTNQQPVRDDHTPAGWPGAPARPPHPPIPLPDPHPQPTPARAA